MTRVFTLQQSLQARAALRRKLDADVEELPIEALIGMLSDEIEQLRAKGATDGEIAKIISTSAGSIVNAQDVTLHYAPPEKRRRN